jgi:hypothetical protein
MTDEEVSKRQSELLSIIRPFIADGDFCSLAFYELQRELLDVITEHRERGNATAEKECEEVFYVCCGTLSDEEKREELIHSLDIRRRSKLGR